MFRPAIGRFPIIQSTTLSLRPLIFVRSARNQAFDATFDPDDLAEARKWHSSFDENELPKGQTSYSRSGGPGGQHVNKLVHYSAFEETVVSFTDRLAVIERRPKQRPSGQYTSSHGFSPS